MVIALVIITEVSFIFQFFTTTIITNSVPFIIRVITRVIISGIKMVISVIVKIVASVVDCAFLVTGTLAGTLDGKIVVWIVVWIVWIVWLHVLILKDFFFCFDNYYLILFMIVIFAADFIVEIPDNF